MERLQKYYNKPSISEEEEAIYASLSVNGNSLKKPSNPKTQKQKENTIEHHKTERDQDDNNSEEECDKVETEELFPHVEDKPRSLTYLNLNNGTLKFSDDWKIHLSREFNDNFSIDVTDLVPTSKLTMNGNKVNALNPDAEVKLARWIRDCMANVEAAIKQRNPSSSSTDGTDESTSGDEY